MKFFMILASTFLMLLMAQVSGGATTLKEVFSPIGILKYALQSYLP